MRTQAEPLLPASVVVLELVVSRSAWLWLPESPHPGWPRALHSPSLSSSSSSTGTSSSSSPPSSSSSNVKDRLEIFRLASFLRSFSRSFSSFLPRHGGCHAHVPDLELPYAQRGAHEFSWRGPTILGHHEVTGKALIMTQETDRNMG